MDRANKTDFDILQALADGERNIAANIAIDIDANRAYINNRLFYLRINGISVHLLKVERLRNYT